MTPNARPSSATPNARYTPLPIAELCAPSHDTCDANPDVVLPVPRIVHADGCDWPVRRVPRLCPLCLEAFLLDGHRTLDWSWVEGVRSAPWTLVTLVARLAVNGKPLGSYSAAQLRDLQAWAAGKASDDLRERERYAAIAGFCARLLAADGVWQVGDTMQPAPAGVAWLDEGDDDLTTLLNPAA